MDITLPRKTLLDLLARALPVTDAKSAMPILANVYLAADFGAQTLTMRATDLLLGYTGARPATVRKPGSVCVPAKLTRDIVAKLPDGDVTIVDERGRVALKSKGARRADSLISIPGEDWPTMPAPEGEVHTIPAATLADVRRLTGYAQSEDAMRPHLQATLFTLLGDALRAVATDGHRLAMASRTVPGMTARHPSRPGAPLSLLVPSLSLARLALPVEGDLRVSSKQGDTGPLFITDVATGDTWSTKLVDAAFPSYEQVIPASHDTSLTCGRAALLESLGAVSTVAGDRTPGVRMSVTDGVLRLEMSNPSMGDMADTVAVEVVGPTAPWGVNADYLGDVLRALAGERVTIHKTGELDPMTVTCPAEGAAFACLIMPMRV